MAPAELSAVLMSREDQVVSLIAEGVSNREIAEQLSIKENTVKKSLLRIYDKLGVSNRVELVLYALTHRDKYTHAAPAKYHPTRAVVHSISTNKSDFVAVVDDGALKTN